MVCLLELFTIYSSILNSTLFANTPAAADNYLRYEREMKFSKLLPEYLVNKQF